MREGGRKEGRKGVREGGREGGREEGRKGGRKGGGREGGRNNTIGLHYTLYQPFCTINRIMWIISRWCQQQLNSLHL